MTVSPFLVIFIFVTVCRFSENKVQWRLLEQYDMRYITVTIVWCDSVCHHRILFEILRVFCSKIRILSPP